LKFDLVVAIFPNLVANDYKSHVVVNGLVTFWLISTGAANQCAIVWPNGKLSPHPLFLCPRLEWKNKNEVWLTTFPIGCNQL